MQTPIDPATLQAGAGGIPPGTPAAAVAGGPGRKREEEMAHTRVERRKPEFGTGWIVRLPNGWPYSTERTWTGYPKPHVFRTRREAREAARGIAFAYAVNSIRAAKTAARASQAEQPARPGGRAMQKTAYDHGFDACRAKKWFCDNPFPTHSGAWHEWNRGYEAAVRQGADALPRAALGA